MILHLTTLAANSLGISGILLITPLLSTSKHTFGHYEIWPSGENLKNQGSIFFFLRNSPEGPPRPSCECSLGGRGIKKFLTFSLVVWPLKHRHPFFGYPFLVPIFFFEKWIPFVWTKLIFVEKNTKRWGRNFFFLISYLKCEVLRINIESCKLKSVFFAKWVPIFNFWVPVPIFFCHFFGPPGTHFFFRYPFYFTDHIWFFEKWARNFFCAKTQKTVPKKWVQVSIFFWFFDRKKTSVPIFQKIRIHFSKWVPKKNGCWCLRG